MSKNKETQKKIPENTYRVIKISKEALFEFVYESIIDKQELFFDVSDGTKIVTSFDMDWEKGSFTIVAQNFSEVPPFYKDIDVGKVSNAIDDTTSTLYSDNRYIELTQEQIDEIQQTKK